MSRMMIAVQPIPNSYWAVDEHLLAGEYPGAKNGADGRAKLRALLESGVRLFIDLTEEGESRLVPYEGLLRETATELGVSARYRRHGIPDMSVPRSAADMEAILDELDEARATGTLAYVHCWGGTGRTGTVVGCHYRRHGASGEEALMEVRRRWSTMEKAPMRPNGSPETAAQRRYVREWAGDPGATS
ncbi:MAG: protein-tyrosine phosphatase family protein [Gemmatimonadota bacterium]